MTVNTEPIKIGVFGLGYVGLPLACLFGSAYKVIGFDINPVRVEQLNSGIDTNNEVGPQKLSDAIRNGFTVTSDINELKSCNVYIIAVPTPVMDDKTPDLSHLIEATENIGRILDEGDTVIYESTVYPGVTENVCVPILQKVSGLKFNIDFFVGYSPERINPGDKLHTVENIPKITSGSTHEAAEFIDLLYSSVLQAPTHLAPSIKVAEAAKLLENTQRDVNIALMNEMSKIFHAVSIDTNDVIKAASTKWNFMGFTPGLVGGHCIGVDPYYLIDMAKEYGVNAPLVTTARKINESMSEYTVERVAELLTQRGKTVKGSSALLLGFTFKEDCNDTRNTRVADIYREFRNRGCEVDIYDPMVNAKETLKEYGIECKTLLEDVPVKPYETIVMCVGHKAFSSFDYRKYSGPDTVVFDVKNYVNRDISDGRL